MAIQMTTIERLTTHVQAAASELDRLRPGWAESIDVGLLDLCSPTCCILGQLFAPNIVGLAVRWFVGGGQSGYTRGCHFLHQHADPERLPGIAYVVFATSLSQDAWIAAIAERLHPVPEPTPTPSNELVAV